METLKEEEKERDKILKEIMDKKFPSHERKYTIRIKKNRLRRWLRGKSAFFVNLVPQFHLHIPQQKERPGSSMLSSYLSHTCTMVCIHHTCMYTIKNNLKNLNRSPNNPPKFEYERYYTIIH